MTVTLCFFAKGVRLDIFVRRPSIPPRLVEYCREMRSLKAMDSLGKRRKAVEAKLEVNNIQGRELRAKLRYKDTYIGRRKFWWVGPREGSCLGKMLVVESARVTQDAGTTDFLVSLPQ